MMSIFPYALGTSDVLGAGKEIHIYCHAQNWLLNTNLVAPKQPLGAVEPDSAGAKALIAGAAAVTGMIVSVW